MKFNYKNCLITKVLLGMKKLDRKRLVKYLTSKRFLFLLFGLLLTIISIIAHFSFPPILKHLIQNTMNLEEGKEFYNWWIKPSVPTEVGIYFFHILNPYEVQNGGKTLRVKEMGKYMFKQHYEREIVSFSADLETITFYERRYYVFDPTHTMGSLDDNITVINAPFAALGSIIPKFVDKIPFLPPFLSSLPYRGVNSFLESHNQSLFINTTIRDLIYGYRLDILDTAEGFAKSLSSYGTPDIWPEHLFPNNSFGILNGRNGTRDGPYEMYTGLSGTENLFGYFKSWNNQNKLKWWNSDSCNAINGSDGTLWPPFMDKSDRLYFYVPDVCRSLYVTFQEESEHKGIKTYIYSAPDNLLAGIDENPENECFCMESDELRDRCRLNGIYDMSSCQNDIPIIMTLPHFLGADPLITNRIEGLKPDPKIHRPVIHVQPTLGAVIHGDSRLQMAIRVPKNEYIRGFENLDSELYVPLFWGYKKLGISDDFAAELRARLFTPVIIIRYTIIMGIITGSLILLISIFVQFLCKKEVLSISLLDDRGIFQGIPDTESDKHETDFDKCDPNIIESSIVELELLMKISPETRL